MNSKFIGGVLLLIGIGCFIFGFNEYNSTAAELSRTQLGQLSSQFVDLGHDSTLAYGGMGLGSLLSLIDLGFLTKNKQAAK